MFAAVPAITPTAMLPCMPRPTPQPLRRLAAVLATGLTILVLMAAIGGPARADQQRGGVAKPLMPALAVGIAVHPGTTARTHPAYLPPLVQVRSPRIPAACAVEISGARRDITVYPERCLRRQGFVDRLPRHCAYQARIFGRTDRVYAQDCLRHAGYRVDSGRHHDRGPRDFGRDRGRWQDRDFGRGHPRPYY
ncbi:hypothetical protein [Pseudotabrizicola formosa]|uniref:hypothetical protein n=1 Tax=Pseudotabrizicola formosa TaxID=2030009 RepID=UPI000CD08D0D|nr:hypothetical protein [Pseudotabrizicola formosa]